MIIIKHLNKQVASRKEAKELLGGTNAYNRSLRNGDLQFINNEIIAINEIHKRRNQTNS